MKGRDVILRHVGEIDVSVGLVAVLAQSLATRGCLAKQHGVMTLSVDQRLEVRFFLIRQLGLSARRLAVLSRESDGVIIMSSQEMGEPSVSSTPVR